MRSQILVTGLFYFDVHLAFKQSCNISNDDDTTTQTCFAILAPFPIRGAQGTKKGVTGYIIGDRI